MVDLGKRLFDLRKERGLTLEEVGQAVGVGRSTVRKWETGQIASMKRDKIKKLSDCLGVSPAYICGWTDDPLDTGAPEATRIEGQIQTLRNALDQLNDEGREKLLDYAADLVASGRYIKTDSLGVGQKEA